MDRDHEGNLARYVRMNVNARLSAVSTLVVVYLDAKRVGGPLHELGSTSGHIQPDRIPAACGNRNQNAKLWAGGLRRLLKLAQRDECAVRMLRAFAVAAQQRRTTQGADPNNSGIPGRTETTSPRHLVFPC
jgi:hypothetical protein